jgi:hypothetical protein
MTRRNELAKALAQLTDRLVTNSLLLGGQFLDRRTGFAA